MAAFNTSPLLPALGLAALPPEPTPSPAGLQALLVEARNAAAAVTKHAQHQQGDGAEAAQQQADALGQAAEAVCAAVAGVRAPFEWVDGPLVEAMRRGDILLVDELNLAEDAVLERLNRWAWPWGRGRLWAGG